MILTIKQTAALDYLEDSTTNEIVFGGGAGGAKSVLGCYWITKMCLKYPGTRWVIGRAVLRTLKETTLNTLWWVFENQGLKAGTHYKYNDQKSFVRFINGSTILFKDLEYYPSDKEFDELGSLEITGAFVDECNQIVYKAWSILKSRIRYRLDEYGIVPKILGTCNPSKNWVFLNFFRPFERNELPINKRFVQALLNDNPFISKHYKDNLLTLDLNSKERLLNGNWNYDSDPTTLCSYEAISDVFTNKIQGGVKAISADLAMQGRDRFIVGVWDGLICTIKVDKLKSRGKEIEEDVSKCMKENNIGHSQTVVDSDGMGSYLESYLEGIKEFHGGAQAINKTEFANLKSECGFKLAEVVNKREINIICTLEQQERIMQELAVLKQDSIDRDEKKKKLISKEKMKELLGHSPDYLDMLLMRMLFLVKKALPPDEELSWDDL